MAKRRLTGRQQKFAEEWCVDFNVTQAAIRAGYAKSSAHVRGHELVTNSKVQAAIAKVLKPLVRKHDITQEKVIAELCTVAFSDLYNIADWGPDMVRLRNAEDIAPQHRRAVESITIRDYKEGSSTHVKMHGKVAALRALAEILQIVEHKESDTGVDIDVNFNINAISAEQVALIRAAFK